MSKEIFSQSAKPFTLIDLGQFTEDVLLPAIEKIIDDKVKIVDDKVDGLRNDMTACFEKVDERLDTVEGMLNRRYEEIDDLCGDIHDVKIRVSKLEALPR